MSHTVLWVISVIKIEKPHIIRGWRAFWIDSDSFLVSANQGAEFKYQFENLPLKSKLVTLIGQPMRFLKITFFIQLTRETCCNLIWWFATILATISRMQLERSIKWYGTWLGRIASGEPPTVNTTRRNPFFIFSLGRTTITLYRAFFRAHSAPHDESLGWRHTDDVTISYRAPPIQRARMLVLNIPGKLCCTSSFMSHTYDSYDMTSWEGLPYTTRRVFLALFLYSDWPVFLIGQQVLIFYHANSFDRSPFLSHADDDSSWVIGNESLSVDKIIPECSNAWLLLFLLFSANNTRLLHS